MRRTIKPRLTQVELAVALAMPLNVVTKAGCERGHGTIWHIAPGAISDGRPALCGARPSLQWSTWGEPQVTCRKCLMLKNE